RTKRLGAAPETGRRGGSSVGRLGGPQGPRLGRSRNHRLVPGNGPPRRDGNGTGPPLPLHNVNGGPRSRERRRHSHARKAHQDQLVSDRRRVGGVPRPRHVRDA
ncbi:hypothetical protein BN1708_020056, partial [Verticillium longisporum]